MDAKLRRLCEQIYIRFDHEKGEAVTNLALQKLIYYAQGWWLGLTGESLFDTDLQAWPHGPVEPTAYEAFRGFGFQSVEMVDVQKAEDPFLDLIVEHYGSIRPKALEVLSHEDRPWKERFVPGSFQQDIPKDSLRSFFRKHAAENPIHDALLSKYQDLLQPWVIVDDSYLKERNIVITTEDLERAEERLGLR